MDAMGPRDRGSWRPRVTPRRLRQMKSVGRDIHAGEKHMPRIDCETGRDQTSKEGFEQEQDGENGLLGGGCCHDSE